MRCNFTGTLLSQVLPPVLAIECILGILCNGLALWIFCFHVKPWKSSTVLLFNLAIADFCLNVALPFRASYYNYVLKWPFGNAMCNICLFMLAMNRTGSTFFLMAIAVDRYMRVVHPHHPINSLSIAKASCGAGALWLITCAMSIHVFSLEHKLGYCESFMVQTRAQPSAVWHKLNYVFTFCPPLLVILYCTVRIIGKLRGRQLAQHAKIKKALWFITVVVVLFVVCFLPSNVIHLMIWIKTNWALANLPESQVCSTVEGLTISFYISISLTYLNSALDPVIYYFSSPAFKSTCRRALHLPAAETTESMEKKTRETGSQSLSQL